ncbi:hypothetical protein AV553_20920 [Salmonella enterica]|nr:hypothetical protein [Salmonella enterica]
MMIKVVIQYPETSAQSFALKQNLIASEYVDIRDLLVRMHSEDRKTRERARKILLNFIFHTSQT